MLCIDGLDLCCCRWVREQKTFVRIAVNDERHVMKVAELKGDAGKLPNEVTVYDWTENANAVADACVPDQYGPRDLRP